MVTSTDTCHPLGQENKNESRHKVGGMPSQPDMEADFIFSKENLGRGWGKLRLLKQ